MKNKCLFLFIIILSSLLVRCGITPLAGGSDNPDFIVIGSVANTDGLPSPNTVVTLAPDSYNPVSDAELSVSMTDTTDINGNYCFTIVHKGAYAIHALQLSQRTRLLITGITVSDDTTRVAGASLTAPGAVKVSLPSTGINAAAGYIYIPGTAVFAFINNHADTVVLDSVPSGLLPMISYAEIKNTGAIALRYKVPVMSGEITTVLNPSWKYARRLFLNTTTTGADVPGPVYNFPLLVRLSADNFDFNGTKADGTDIRFAKPDNTPLPHEIEQWDPVSGTAAIWVKVDTVRGANESQCIVMYWGNSEAANGSNGAAVFDTSNGFQGVWHLNGSGNATVYDATGNRYDGTPFNMTPASSVPGAIGSARSFNGTSQYITMPNTAAGKLDFPQNGNFSMSVWVYTDTIDTIWRAIAGKGREQYYMQQKNFGKGRATWEFVEFQEQKGWDYTEDSVPPAPGARTWINIVGVRSGISQRLYINGKLVIDSISLMTGAYPRVTTDNFFIGRFARLITIPYAQGLSYFKGKIDEVRVCSGAPTDDWIRLSYMNQKNNDALVLFNQP